MTEKEEAVHRYLDECGDTTFFGRGRAFIVGTPGVSLSFSLGMLKVKGPVDEYRGQLAGLADAIARDPYFIEVPSIKKRLAKGGFHFHAKDDIPEVRERMFRWIKGADLSLQICVARKDPHRFAAKHHGDEAEFYADVLGHLIKDKLEMGGKLVLNVANRQNSTGNRNLKKALDKAVGHLMHRKADAEVTTKVVFNVTTPAREPMLWVADYLCWTVQRVFERGETRHYEFVRDKIAQVCDLYDTGNYVGGGNFYGRNKPLSTANKICPPSL